VGDGGTVSHSMPGLVDAVMPSMTPAGQHAAGLRSALRAIRFGSLRNSFLPLVAVTEV